MEIDKLFELYKEIKTEDLKLLLESQFYLPDTYYEYEFTYEFRYNDDPYGAYMAAAYDVISKNPSEYEQFKQDIKGMYNNLLENEIMLCIVTLIAQYFNSRMTQYKALVQGDEWRYDVDKVEYYGSRNKAENQGYDAYMESHLDGDYYLFNRIYEEYFNNDKSLGTK